MRMISYYGLLIVLLSATPPGSANAESAARKSDVLLILVDQWNPRCIGYQPGSQVKTPNIDSIAKEGMIFENGYTTSPVCMPARIALLTGLFPHNQKHGCFSNPNDYITPPEEARLFRDVRAAGYSTAQIGKLHWWTGASWKKQFKNLNEYFAAIGLDHGEPIAEPYSVQKDGNGPYERRLKELGLLDAYASDMHERLLVDQYLVRPSAAPPGEDADSFVATRAIEFIRRQEKEKPLFLVVSFSGPHTPLDAPGEYATMFDPAKIELAPNAVEKFNYGGTMVDRASLQKMTANYYGKMALIDHNIGRLVEAMKERGAWNDAFVALTADHGEMMGAHGALAKGRFWEESVGVPLFVRWPNRVRAGRTEALALTMDLYPTIVEAIGAPLSGGHFARSLLPVATGKSAGVRDAVLSEIGKKSLGYMVRSSRYKRWVADDEEFLFDLQQDPYETKNLLADSASAGVLAQMKETLLAQLMTNQVNYAENAKSKVQRTREAAGKKN